MREIVGQRRTNPENIEIAYLDVGPDMVFTSLLDAAAEINLDTHFANRPTILKSEWTSMYSVEGTCSSRMLQPTIAVKDTGN